MIKIGPRELHARKVKQEVYFFRITYTPPSNNNQ